MVARNPNGSLEAERRVGKFMVAWGLALAFLAVALAVGGWLGVMPMKPAIYFALAIAPVGLLSSALGVLVARRAGKSDARPIGPRAILLYAVAVAIFALFDLPRAILQPGLKTAAAVVVPLAFSAACVVVYRARRRQNDQSPDEVA